MPYDQSKWCFRLYIEGLVVEMKLEKKTVVQDQLKKFFGIPGQGFTIISNQFTIDSVIPVKMINGEIN